MTNCSSFRGAYYKKQHSLILLFIALKAFYWAAADWFCTISNTYNSCLGTICLLFYLLTLLMFNFMSLIRKFSFPPVLIFEKIRGQPQGRMLCRDSVSVQPPHPFSIQATIFVPSLQICVEALPHGGLS